MDPEQNQITNILKNIPGQNPTPLEQEAAATPNLSTGVKNDERTPIKSLRTFQGDVQEAMSKNKTSTTTVFVAEEKRRLENPTPETAYRQNKTRNKTFIILGTLLIVIGTGAVFGIYFWKSNEKVVIEQKTKTLIAFSEERQISIDNLHKSEFVSKFLQNINTWKASVNSVLYLNPFSDGQEIAIEYLLSILGPNMPASLVRSFGKQYMLGIYSFDTNEPFIILKVSDYSLAYPGMLKWEKDMSKDLGLIFKIQSENGTTTRAFVDETIKNKDIRALKDSAGNSLLLYSFIDRQTLVIAKNENILSAIVGKFLINKQVK